MPKATLPSALAAILASMVLSFLFALPPPRLRVSLAPVVTSGLTKPVYLTHAGDGSGRLFVVELEGRIRLIRNGVLNSTPFLDIQSKVTCCQEQGLYNVAFDPEYKTNGTFYVNYINKNWDTVIERYVVADPAADAADLVAVTTVLVVEQPYFNHNGGQMQFGPRDRYLYISLGDGGGSGDPENRGQSLDTLLGKILRLDVRGVATYTIPATNPFSQTAGVRPEIWAYGLRNAWRFSFDRATGDLYIGDVGAACYEEVDYEPAGTPGGRNYGWRLMEGAHAFNRLDPSACSQPRITPPGVSLPVFQYSHVWGFAVTGGYVYRGREFPELNGVYFYADFGSGRIWALRQVSSGNWSSSELLNTPYAISSFGEDESGELYVLSFGDGQVFKLAWRAGALR